MSVYPIEVRKLTMQHRTHEKDYHQVLIITAAGPSLVINRWGKRNATGQREHLHFEDGAAAQRAFMKKNKDKQDGGYLYSSAKDKSVTCNDDAEFKKAVGDLYWYQLGDNLDRLVPGIDMTGVHKPDKPTFDVDGNGDIVRKGYQPKNTFKEPEPTVEDFINANSNWGMF